VVDRKEFAAFMLEKERTLRAVFGSMPKDANGAVDPADFAYAMRQFRVHVQPGVVRALRRSAVKQLIRTVDSDGDGVITYDEYVADTLASLTFTVMRLTP
jgi:Ca2+-binding EF-hand superfamily protein